MTLEFLVDALQTLVAGVATNVVRVLLYPVDPSQRIFVLYLLTSLFFGVAVHAFQRRAGTGASRSVWKFLFPPEVWRTRSAWLDVRYFFLHQILRVFLYSSVAFAVSDWTYESVTAARGDVASIDGGDTSGWMMGLAYGLLSVAFLDLVSYAMHYCQHRIPMLWNFHRVHHSARVMHPLTNYREHPVDNVLYTVGTGASLGLTAGVAALLLGRVPVEPTVLGVGIFAFAFNVSGYNLRHSHVWLRWPGKLAYVLGCPAHHQVHHSWHRDHVNKNFAFLFPVWDVIFGTFELPATNKDVKFGLGAEQDDEADFSSCLRLYWVPFRDLWKSRK